VHYSTQTWEPHHLHRRTKVLNLIEPETHIGLEIGPLDRPLVPRDQGNIRYMDHATTDQLREKYHDHDNVNCDRIVDIDYVWGPEPLNRVVAEDQRFDYILASHVAEHVPDLIGWLRELHGVLKEDGILSLVIPDRRYTFDHLREPSSTGDLIDAFYLGSRRPTPGQVFDHFSRCVNLDLDQAWQGTIQPHELPRKFSDEEALAQASRARESDAYIDVHCWIFTPRSFFSRFADLVRLDLIDYTVAGFFPPVTDTNEFFVSLRALPATGDRAAQRVTQLSSIPLDEAGLSVTDDPRDIAAGLGTLTQLLADKESETQELSEAAAQKDERIADLLSSTSWRVTAPFRWVTRRARR
jgi:SAM-dependent methyltransferase